MQKIKAHRGIQKNEGLWSKVLEVALQNDQSLSPRSSASLYLVTQSSTPCAKLANSFDAIFASRYSIVSGVRVTVRDILRVLFMQGKFLWKLINNDTYVPFSTRKIRVGELQNDRKHNHSGRSASRNEKGILRQIVGSGHDGSGREAEDARPHEPGGLRQHTGRDRPGDRRDVRGYRIDHRGPGGTLMDIHELIKDTRAALAIGSSGGTGRDAA